MKNIFILLMLLFTGTAAFSQSFVGSTRKHVRDRLVTYLDKNNIKGSFTESDSTLTLRILVGTPSAADFIYHFNDAGKCIVQTSLSCEECIKKYVDNLLEHKKVKWTRINEYRYISQFSKHLELIISPDQRSYTVRQTNWNRREYSALKAQI